MSLAISRRSWAISCRSFASSSSCGVGADTLLCTDVLLDVDVFDVVLCVDVFIDVLLDVLLDVDVLLCAACWSVKSSRRSAKKSRRSARASFLSRYQSRLSRYWFCASRIWFCLTCAGSFGSI